MLATKSSRITPSKFAGYCRLAALTNPANSHLYFKNAKELEAANLAPEVIFDYRQQQFVGDVECEVHLRGWVSISTRGVRHYHLQRSIYWPDGLIEVRSGIR